MDSYTFGRKQKKIQWRENLPIVMTVVGVIGLIYGVATLIISQMKPEAEPISTITITKNTPSASELNLSAPLVDYHPNKDECQEEKLNDEETDEERDKRLAECKEKKEKEEKEKEKDDTEVASDETTDVLGEQSSRASMMEALAKVIGASAAKNNGIKNMNDSSGEKEAAGLPSSAAGSADSSDDKVDNGVGENADN